MSTSWGEIIVIYIIAIFIFYVIINVVILFNLPSSLEILIFILLWLMCMGYIVSYFKQKPSRNTRNNTTYMGKKKKYWTTSYGDILNENIVPIIPFIN